MSRVIHQTIKLKLNLSDEQKDIFLTTAQQYSYAAQKVMDYAFNNKVWGNVSLHNKTYYTVKANTQLPSQLICSARLRAAKSIKTYFNKKGKRSKPCFKTLLSISYDAGSFSINTSEGLVSLATIEGRQKVNFHTPRYYLSWGLRPFPQQPTDKFPDVCYITFIRCKAMKKTFKYRIKASKHKQTLQKATLWLTLCRNLYNSALEERIRIHKETGKSLSCNAQKKQLPIFKKAAPEYKQVNSQTLQDVLERLDRAFQAFFRRVKNKEKPGFPRFKGYWRYDSFTLKQTGWKLGGQHLIIKNIGKFKMIFHRPIEGTIKTVTIRRSSSGKWFACFSCDNVPVKPLPKTGNIVGIDMGLESFLVDSNGVKVENPRWLERSSELLKKRQRGLSDKKKGSNRRRKARLLVAKIHEKIRNQRRDFHFKTALWLLRSNDIVCVEKMNSWTSYRSLNRSMRDTA